MDLALAVSVGSCIQVCHVELRMSFDVEVSIDRPFRHSSLSSDWVGSRETSVATVCSSLFS